MRRHEEAVDHLAKVPLFSLCSRAELRAISRQSSLSIVSPGGILAHEGRRGRDFFVIASGEAEVTRRGVLVAKIGPGGFFGELALLDPAPRDATVTAITEMEIFVLSALEFSAVLADAPGLTLKLMQGMAQRLRALDLERSK
jgi:CRP-like cAMP-binding protein